MKNTSTDGDTDMQRPVEIAIVRGTVALSKKSKHYPQALDFIQDLIENVEKQQFT